MRHLTQDPVAGIFSSLGPQSSQWDNEDKRRGRCTLLRGRMHHSALGLNVLLQVPTQCRPNCSALCEESVASSVQNVQEWLCWAENSDVHCTLCGEGSAGSCTQPKPCLDVVDTSEAPPLPSLQWPETPLWCALSVACKNLTPPASHEGPRRVVSAPPMISSS